MWVDCCGHSEDGTSSHANLGLKNYIGSVPDWERGFRRNVVSVLAWLLKYDHAMLYRLAGPYDSDTPNARNGRVVDFLESFNLKLDLLLLPPLRTSAEVVEIERNDSSDRNHDSRDRKCKSYVVCQLDHRASGTSKFL